MKIVIMNSNLQVNDLTPLAEYLKFKEIDDVLIIKDIDLFENELEKDNENIFIIHTDTVQLSSSPSENKININNINNKLIVLSNVKDKFIEIDSVLNNFRYIYRNSFSKIDNKENIKDIYEIIFLNILKILNKKHLYKIENKFFNYNTKNGEFICNKNQAKITFGKIEKSVLSYILNNNNKILTNDMILFNSILNYEDYKDVEVLPLEIADEIVLKLNNKIEEICDFKLIKTIQRRGYICKIPISKS